MSKIAIEAQSPILNGRSVRDSPGPSHYLSSKTGSDRLGISVIVMHDAASSAATLHAKATGGTHVE